MRYIENENALARSMPDRPNHVIANAGLLFRNSLEVCQAISTPPDSAPHRREALSSILFAAISVEAFINELGEFASLSADGQDVPAWIPALGSKLADAEKSKESVKSKYQLARQFLTSQPFDTGAQPFQDFSLLTDVRNSLVHIKSKPAKLAKNDSGVYEWSEPPLMRRLMRRLQSANIDLLDESLRRAVERYNAAEIVTDMNAQISTQAVAIWACRAAAGIVNGTIDVIPQGSLRAVIEAACMSFKLELA